MSRKSDDEEIDGAVGVIFMFLGLMVGMVLKQTAGRALYLLEHMGADDHPRRHWLKPLFITPLVLIVIGILVMFADPMTGFVVILTTVFVFWIVVSVLAFFSDTVKAPRAPAKDNLEDHLGSFGPEEPTPEPQPVQPTNQSAAVLIADRFLTMMERSMDIEKIAEDPAMEGEDALVAYLRGKSTEDSPLAALRALLRK